MDGEPVHSTSKEIREKESAADLIIDEGFLGLDHASSISGEYLT